MSIHTDFIRAWLARWEGTERVGYIPCRRTNFTGFSSYDANVYGEVLGASGVTIGSGLDLGQQTAADLRRMGVPAALVARLSPYLGKRKMDAVAALLAQPLTLTEAECKTLDEAVHSDYITRAAKLYDAEADMPFAACPKEAQAVIVSLFYQLGVGRVYPVTWRALCAGDWPSASRELQTGFTHYANRRADEGRLLAGLAAGAASEGA